MSLVRWTNWRQVAAALLVGLGLTSPAISGDDDGHGEKLDAIHHVADGTELAWDGKSIGEIARGIIGASRPTPSLAPVTSRRCSATGCAAG